MAHQPLTIANPKIEYLTNPIGIDIERPRFSWTLESGEANQRQIAWQVRVSRDPSNADAELWDSGRVESNAMNQIVYGGSLLGSSERASWTVRVWNQDDQASAWLAPQFWETGLLEPVDWLAKWISIPDLAPDTEIEETDNLDGLLPASYLRTLFVVEKPIAKARLYATARGIYEPHLNGSVIGDQVFAPGWTDYLRRIQYQTYDVTAQLTQGENVLGSVLATGWFAGYVGWRKQARMYGPSPALLMQIHMTYEDGSSDVVGTGLEWQGTTGPIRYSDFQMGEWYDARRDLGAWDAAGDSDSGWGRVQIAGVGHLPLVADRSEPVRALETFAPIARTEPLPGVYVFDLGQNIAGWVSLRVNGPTGTKVTLRFSEILSSDGTIYVENLRDARATDTFILAGTGDEVFTPRFTFHGFRYVEVSGYPGVPELDAVSGQFVGSDTRPTAEFSCSDELTNKLYKNIVYGQRGNFLSVPTDCPQRDERLGWLGDAQVFVGTASYNMDVAAFFTKWMVDVDDAQSEAGAYSNVAPRAVDSRDSAPAWADCGLIVPWTIWQKYGDTRIIDDHWSAMERWMAYLLKWNPDYLWKNRRGNDYGDWLSIGADTDKELIGSAYFARDAWLMAEIAKATGRDAAQTRYRTQFEAMRQAFQSAYIDADGTMRGDTQTAYCLGLHFDLVPEVLILKVVDRLIADIRAKGTHISTGFVGVSYLCHVLTSVGRSDLAYELLHQQGYPGWKYSILQGATTIWERWDGWTEDKGFQTPAMNSFNHYSLGSVGEWMFRSMAGIGQAEESAGFARIRIQPEIDASLSFVEASYDSIRGRISSRWDRDDHEIRLRVSIPVNCAGEVWLGGDVTVVGSGAHSFSLPV